MNLLTGNEGLRADDESNGTNDYCALESQNRELKLAIARLRQLSYLDDVTGLLNRRYLDRALDGKIDRASRAQSPFSLLLCDVDHFACYNDVLGHRAGDTILRMLGTTLRDCASRIGDIAVRYGSDAFALLLQATGPLDALRFAETLRRRVAGLPVPKPSPTSPPRLTVSIGVTTFHFASPCRPDAILRVANDALDRAKRSGRNRTSYRALELPAHRACICEPLARARRPIPGGPAPAEWDPKTP